MWFDEKQVDLVNKNQFDFLASFSDKDSIKGVPAKPTF
jgi:hypothetical protein